MDLESRECFTGKNDKTGNSSFACRGYLILVKNRLPKGYKIQAHIDR